MHKLIIHHDIGISQQGGKLQKDSWNLGHVYIELRHNDDSVVCGIESGWNESAKQYREYRPHGKERLELAKAYESQNLGERVLYSKTIEITEEQYLKAKQELGQYAQYVGQAMESQTYGITDNNCTHFVNHIYHKMGLEGDYTRQYSTMELNQIGSSLTKHYQKLGFYAGDTEQTVISNKAIKDIAQQYNVDSSFISPKELTSGIADPDGQLEFQHEVDKRTFIIEPNPIVLQNIQTLNTKIRGLKNGDLDSIELLLSQGADINYNNPCTILCTAARSKDANLIQYLLSKNAKVDIKSQGNLPINTLRWDDFQCRKLLMDAAKTQGVDLHNYYLYKPYSGDSIFNQCVHYNDFPSIALMIADGISPNQTYCRVSLLEKYIEELCHIPIGCSNTAELQMISCLIQNKANLEGGRLLYKTIYNQSYDAAKLLIEAGDSVDYQNESGEGLLYCLIGNNKELQQSKIDVMQLLIHNGVDINVRRCNQTILEELLYQDPASTQEATLLINAGVDLQYISHLRGYTYLHISTNNNLPDIAKMLIEKGVDIEIQDDYGNTALELGVSSNNKEIVSLLLGAGSKLTVKENHETLLRQAAGYKGCPEIVELLCIAAHRQGWSIENYIDLEHKHPNSHPTAFTEAIYNHQISSAEILINHGANIYAKPLKGLAPFHYGAYNGYLNIVEFFLKHNVNPNLISEPWGGTVLHSALDGRSHHKHYVKIAIMLLNSGADTNIKSNHYCYSTVWDLILRADSKQLAQYMLDHKAQKVSSFDIQYEEREKSKEMLSLLLGYYNTTVLKSKEAKAEHGRLEKFSSSSVVDEPREDASTTTDKEVKETSVLPHTTTHPVGNCVGNVDFSPFVPVDALNVKVSDNIKKAALAAPVASTALCQVDPVCMAIDTVSGVLATAVADVYDGNAPLDVSITGERNTPTSESMKDTATTDDKMPKETPVLSHMTNNCVGNMDFSPFVPIDTLNVNVSDNIKKATLVGAAAVAIPCQGNPRCVAIGAVSGVLATAVADAYDGNSPLDVSIIGVRNDAADQMSHLAHNRQEKLSSSSVIDDPISTTPDQMAKESSVLPHTTTHPVGNCVGNVDFSPFVPVDTLNVTVSDNIKKAALVGAAAVVIPCQGNPLCVVTGSVSGVLAAGVADVYDGNAPLDVSIIGDQIDPTD